MSPSVAIVILNWNGKKFLETFLPSVLASTYENFRVVIADNASQDDSLVFLREHYPNLEIIVLKENLGFAGGYNEALKNVKADYYVLLNSDVEVMPSWIEPIISLMEIDRKIAACQPKLLLHSDRSSFEYSGACGGWLDRFGYPFARGRIFDHCEKDEGQYDSTEPVFWASGAAMFVRADLYHAFGGLDPYFFAHQEEIDFCWRLQLAGYLIYCCPDSVVYHVGGGTLPKGNARKVFLNFRNNLIMMARNMHPTEAAWKISYRFLLDGISAGKSLLAGQFSYFFAVFRAHLAFLGWLFTRFQRTPRSKEQVVLKGYLHRSVVWAHFVLGMKKFSEIVAGKN